MRGYWRDDEATAEVIDADGWFHTGDVGHLDADGYLVITDRIKDLIITAQGKNIAPTPIETALMASPLVELAVVVGDRQRYLTALIQPAFAELEQLAQMHRWPTDRAELVAHPEVIAMYEDLVTEAGRDAAHFERVHRFRLIADELTMESGDLTPTLKVRRRVIGQKYAPLIEQMYSDEQA
ncbi:MAG: long-chain fatty acid--CoA ligase, partial [Micrococcales bacterium]